MRIFLRRLANLDGFSWIARISEVGVTEAVITTYLFEGFSLRIAGAEIRLSSAGHPIPLNQAESQTLKELVENAGDLSRKNAWST